MNEAMDTSKEAWTRQIDWRPSQDACEAAFRKIYTSILKTVDLPDGSDMEICMHIYRKKVHDAVEGGLGKLACDFECRQMNRKNIRGVKEGIGNQSWIGHQKNALTSNKGC